MIDIKKHTVTEGKTTYDIRIYTDLSKLPHKFIQLVKLTKEEVLKVIATYKLSPNILSKNIYNNLLDIKEN
ncbi:hypothetical protein VNN37_06390 [Lactococcus garvieae]|uniref:hypothetical protein n=1 Tax=Lactococcus garvieae TaxID=1363 RepID=UPI0030CBF53B